MLFTTNYMPTGVRPWLLPWWQIQIITHIIGQKKQLQLHVYRSATNKINNKLRCVLACYSVDYNSLSPVMTDNSAK